MLKPALVIAVIAGVLSAPAAAEARPAPNATNAKAAFTVTAEVSPKQVIIGKKAAIAGTVSPVRDGAKVAIQRKQGSQWVTVATRPIAADGSYRYSFRPAKPGQFPYRAHVGAVGAIGAGNSPARNVNVYKWHYVYDMDWVTSSQFVQNTLTINGDEYKKSVYNYLYFEGDEGYFEVNLSRKCSTLKTVVGMSDESSSDAEANLEILGDGNSLYSWSFGLGETQSPAIKVANVLRIRVEGTGLSDADESDAALGSPRVLCRF